MSETSEIEILPPEEPVEAQERPIRHIGFKTLVITSVIAGLCGSVGGAALSTFFNTPAPNITPLETKLSALTKENAALKAQILRVQKDVKSIPKAASVDLSGIRSRLETLESTEPQEIDPDLIARLEALNVEGSDALDLSEIYARLETLEKRPAIVAAPKTTAIASQPFAEMPFPKDALIASIGDNKAPQSWLEKTLNKHISVRAEDDPRILIEGIEADLENGDTLAAASKFDRLPENVKTAGREWREGLGQ